MCCAKCFFPLQTPVIVYQAQCVRAHQKSHYAIQAMEELHGSDCLHNLGMRNSLFQHITDTKNEEYTKHGIQDKVITG